MAKQLRHLAVIALSAALLLQTDAHKNHQKRVHGRQDELDVSGLASLPAVASSTSDNATVAQEFKCKEAGFFGSDEDCTLFYRCVDYFGTGEHFSLFTFQCAPGTIFDQSISVCNHPDWVEPKPKCLKASEEPATGASSAQGSQVPSIASAGNGGASSGTSAPESLVSVTTESSVSGTTTCVCTSTPGPLVSTPSVPVLEVNAPTTIAAPTTVAPEGTTLPSVGSEGTTAPSAGSEGTTAPSVGSEGTTAPSVGSEGTTVPFIGSEGTTAPSVGSEGTTAPSVGPTDASSAESTTLSPATEAPFSATDSPSSASNAPTIASGSSIIDSEGPTVSPLPSPPGVPSTGSSEAFVLVCGDQAFHRHPLDCKLYYQCIWSGFAFTFNLFSCQGDNIYDEASGACTSPDKTSPCEIKAMPALPVMNVTALPGGETTVSPTTAIDNPQYTLAPGSLYDCPKPGHYPYQLDCIRFYRCFEISPGVLKGLLYRCPPGYGYSKAKERCEKEETLGTCDISIVRKGSIPVPVFPLEQAIMVPVKDFNYFFNNPNFFYFPRQSNRRILLN